MTVTILLGDVREQLKTLTDESVNCVVTSPPYWALRDYGVAGQLGLEPTPQEHVAAMVDVFREIRRVLRRDGVCWVNYGDSYAGNVNGRSAADTKATGNDDRTFRDKPINNAVGGLKPKDLCMVPFRFALAMQDDGWWLRSILPWVKRNGMPESIKDRPASAVEYVFMFTRAARYAYDADAVRRLLAPASVGRLSQDVDAQEGSARANGGRKTNGNMKAVGRFRAVPPRHAQYESSDQSGLDEVPRGDRNFRNADLFFESLGGPYGLLSAENGEPLALDVPPQPFRDAHFATFPPKLIEPLIKAGCPKGGVVLDPFGGAGTTGLVADRQQRDAILIELNPEYAAIAERRIKGDASLLADVTSPKEAA
ncbi:DNA-methyltransferase [Reyranella sp.]|uniref:DNA-methyltransferase n=1 Tax=Reyranella sp. TaxID=1929291 RepID=UPI004035F065